MASGPYSFIDIAVLDAVRGRFAAGDALAILSIDLETVLWANGAGAALLGHSDIEAAMGARSGLGLPARRQIAATPGFPRSVLDRQVAVRLAGGVASRLAAFVVSSITLPDGEPAILIAEPASKKAALTAGEVAERVIAGIGEAGYFAAILDADAGIAARSDGFDTLGIAPATLAALVDEVARENDRLVKQLVPGAAGMIPAGIARLADEPALHLLIVIDEAVDQPVPGDDEQEVAGDIAPREDAQHDEDVAVDAEPERAGAASRGNVGAASADGMSSSDERRDETESPLPSDADLAERIDEDMAAASELASETPDPRPGSETAIRSAAAAASDSDDWYFSRRQDTDRSPTTATATAPAAVIDRSAGPVRFVWRTDASGAFSMLSPEFARAVGPHAADIVGQPFGEVARRFKFDRDGEIARLLEHRDTWSGRTVMWPVAGTDHVVPVDLAALPNYSRDREFEGFRGFGVVRMGDAVPDPARLGLRLAEAIATADDAGVARTPSDAANDARAETPVQDEAGTDQPSARDPFKGEVPVISIADRRDRQKSDKIIRLAERRPPPDGRQLSAGERNAFEEIRERLRRDYEAGRDQPATPASAQTADEAPIEDLSPETPDTETVEPAPEIDTAGEPQPGPVEVGDDYHDIPDLAALDGIKEDTFEATELPDEQVVSVDPEETVDANSELDAEVAAYEEAAIAEERAEDSPSAEHVVDGSDAEVPTAATEDMGGSDPAEAAATTLDTVPETRNVEKAGKARSEVPLAPAAAYLPSAFAGESGRPGIDADLVAALPLPILIHAGDELYFANREFLALTGYSSLDQIRREGGLGSLFAAGEPQMVAGDEGRKLRLRTLGGDEFPVDAHLQSVRWRNGTALLLALRKVAVQPTPTTAAAAPIAAPGVIGIEEMERRVAEMRTIVDTATDGVVLIASNGTIRSISRPAEALFGFDSAEVEGKQFHTLFAIESQRAARDYLNGLADNGVASVLNDGREVIGREAEGRFIPLFMTIGRLPHDGGFCAVVRDITQWKRAEEDLTQARAQAERASSQKTEFLARVSHEIRTPLNAIIGFSELMIDEKFGPIHNDRYRDYLRDINRSGNHVLDLVNDLLDISKIEAGEQEMNYEAVSLNDTLAESVAMMQPQANRDRVIIRSSLASRLPEVVADLRSVRQIALNLLSNAIRYTQAGGQVIVSTAYEPSGDVVMRVRDTGIGMSLSEIDQALKPFKQINALKRGRHDGTGLGLPLTKAMVEANRARFAISSTPGEGTMVEITFPSTRVLAD